jgi:2-polyprenyl-6-methoxyphenol hydroxylase-like FAD-dependent oxidoreductase
MTLADAAGRTALVVGAGIGGLAAGIALRQSGWEVRVLERTPTLAAPGAGLSIWPNGVRALRSLGLDGPVDAAPRSTGALRKADGTELTRFETVDLQERFGEPLIGLHRATLQGALAELLGPDRIRTGAAVSGLADGGVLLADGTEEHAELVVGADGIRSAVRAAVLGDGEPEDSGTVAFRGVAPMPGEELPAGEWWGPGCVAGLLQLPEDRVYWYVAFRGDVGDQEAMEAHLSDFAPVMRKVVARTAPREVLSHRLYDREPAERWTAGQTTLLGDAAHPMLPFLGQGANAALEDAAALGRAMEDAPDMPAGLRAYEAARVEPAARLVKGSRQAARFALAGSAPARAVRNAIVRLLPPRTRLRQLDRLIGRP